jgi:hypothetical protein
VVGAEVHRIHLPPAGERHAGEGGGRDHGRDAGDQLAAAESTRLRHV